MRHFNIICSALLLGTLALSSQVASAQMEGSVLFVAPHRLIVSSAQKSETISVSNKSDKPRRYDLTMIDQAMTDKGVTERKDNFEYSVKSMVNYTPKRFTLQPGQSQVVRVVVNRPDKLADGDYHSHLLFREVPLNRKDKEALRDDRKEAEKTVSFEIRTLYGIAVPVVVQAGTVTSDISMGEPALGKSADGKPQLKIDFARSGNSEAAGKLSAEYVQADGKNIPAIDPQWIRMYRESDKVSKTFDLAGLPEGASGGTVVLSFMKDENDPAKTVKKEISLK